ncbi:MAG: BrnT family toxin [Sphingomicrobium sp.]
MEISFDSEKRAWTVAHRGLDFDQATMVFAGPEHTVRHDRSDYGEERLFTYG